MDLHVPDSLRRSLEALGLQPRQVLWAGVGTLSAVWLVRWMLAPGKPKAPGATDFNSYLIENKTMRPSTKAAEIPATSFDAYLIKRKPAPLSTSFDAYLKEAEPGAGGVPEAAEAQGTKDEGPEPDQVVVTVLFGTEYGFAKEIAEKLTAQLRQAGKYWPCMVDMADVPEGLDLAEEQAVLVVCSTQGDGVPPSEARDFCDWLEGPASPQLPATYYSVCALGDTSYEHYCACGKQLDARLAALTAQQLAPRTDVNREDWKAINLWMDAVLAELGKLKLKTAAEVGGVYGSVQQSTRVGKNRPYMGRVVAVEGLCELQDENDKDTIRVEIDLGDSGLDYTPGDALGIYPTNDPEAVEELLTVLGADGGEERSLPSWHYAEDDRQSGSSTLREVLTKCYDLRSPKADLLQLLWDLRPQEAGLQNAHKKGYANGHSNGYMNGHANGHANGSVISPAAMESSDKKSSAAKQVKRLAELIAARSDANSVEAYFEERHVIDVLEDFSFSRPSVDELLQTLRPLQPRLYSISSSPLEAPARVQATVAVVRYSTLGRKRVGVASTHLKDRLQVGDGLPVYIAKTPDFRLPADPATPIIMVGPGTGLAPFRAFMMHRILSMSSTGKPFGTSLLFFGCRRRDQDYLYGPVLERWADHGLLRLFTAFSREQGRKVYVQQRLREQGELVWELLGAGAHFYVCGDAAHMASAVEEALTDILAHNLGGDADQAQAYLDDLRRSNRYQRDVWF